MARIIADRLGGRLILEQHDENPFLTDFYRDPARYALSTQLFFLLWRYQQLQELSQQDIFFPHVVSDYTFAKNRIFAYLNLEERELKLYENIHTSMDRNLPRPDLVIYLQSSLERLMQNIRKRGRAYEKNITEEYIQSLSEAYNHFFFHYNETPLLVVNATRLDFVNHQEDLEALLSQVDRHPGGMVFFNPNVS